jgi:hypothetical protein
VSCHACGPWADKKAGLSQNFTPGYRWGSHTVSGHALSASRSLRTAIRLGISPMLRGAVERREAGRPASAQEWQTAQLGGLSTGPQTEERIGVSGSQCQARPIHSQAHSRVHDAGQDHARVQPNSSRDSAGTDCARCTGSRDRSDDSATRREWQSQSGGDFPTITDDGNSLSPVI